MKDRREGFWVDFGSIPNFHKDWLVTEVSKDPPLFSGLRLLSVQIMNDWSIPFIHEYGEWAILDAARMSAANWGKGRYNEHLMEVPENRRYLAENLKKRNPNAPRGARFLVRSSKHNHISPPDNDSSNNERIPVLPPGPSAATNQDVSPGGVADWSFSPNKPAQPLPGPLQLPFSDGFSWSTPPPWTCSLDQKHPQMTQG